MLKRPRRNRKSEVIRSLVQETRLDPKDFVAPFFLTEGINIISPITSIPGQFHLSCNTVSQKIEELLELGISSYIFFPLIAAKYKDKTGSYAISESNHLLKTIRRIKENYPEICIFADIALDPFTTHGHDGLLSSSGEVLNDETIVALSKMSQHYAEAGVDVIAPSDMMDGRIKYIRRALDQAGHENVSIMSYSAKYASAFYGPFRDALKSTPSLGDKKSYQMNPANSKEALLEALLDEEEGADFLMVKPATLYLDIIQKIKEKSLLPIAAYHVSGEYAMLKAAAQNKWLDFDKALYESLIGIKRAGADIIISYGAKEIITYLLKHS